LKWLFENDLFTKKSEAKEFIEKMIDFGIIFEINNETRFIEHSIYYFKLMPVKKSIKEGYLMKKGQVKCSYHFLKFFYFSLFFYFI
jgi:hypothetical protein